MLGFGVRTLLIIVAGTLLVGNAALARAGASNETSDMLAVAAAFNEAREICYSSSGCPNIDALMALFSDEPRRTDIQRRNNNVVLLEGRDAIRADHVRVATTFTGRRLETTAMTVQGATWSFLS